MFLRDCVILLRKLRWKTIFGKRFLKCIINLFLAEINSFLKIFFVKFGTMSRGGLPERPNAAKSVFLDKSPYKNHFSMPDIYSILVSEKRKE